MNELTPQEVDAVADGEPYCCRCGRPASSFPIYATLYGPGTPAELVRREEGTYNPDTNRFACDDCYIDMGEPTAPGGWKAP